MSKAGKLVKDIVKAKKESVMGKLGDSPYEDPMEPWSAKYNAPVRNEESENLEEDSWLFRYIKSLGYNPKIMPFAQRAKYARSNAFKHYKQSHMNTPMVQQEGLADDMLKLAQSKGIKGKIVTTAQKKKETETLLKKRAEKAKSDPVKTQKSEPNDKYPLGGYDPVSNRSYSEEVELQEAGTGLLMSYIKSKGLDPNTMDSNKRNAYSKSSEYRVFKMRHLNKKIKETSGMGERGDDWNEETIHVGHRNSKGDWIKTSTHTNYPDAKKAMADLEKQGKKGVQHRYDHKGNIDPGQRRLANEEADKADTVTMDIPLLIRVLEYAREDAKTDMDLHKVVENLIAMRGKGTLSMDMYNKIVAIKEEIEKLDELKSSTYTSYIDKVADPKVASQRGKTPTGTLKSIKAIGGVAKAIGKRAKAQSKEISELKKQDDNMEIADRITREDLRQWFSKTHPEGDWKRINSKGEVVGPCAREPGEPKPKCMSKEKRAQLSKKERAAAVAAKRKHDPVADRSGKGGKPINVSNYGKGKLGEDVEQLDEKNKPTNPALWSRAKSLARSKFDVYPSAYANGWASKWYKSKGGGWKSVKEDTVQEGIYGIEDSPLSATNSVKAMESSHRAKQMKSARMIKSLYKKKLKETLYDWEKDDKGGTTPNAKIVLKGGKTLTGKDRDTVEIEPVLRTRPNSLNNK